MVNLGFNVGTPTPSFTCATIDSSGRTQEVHLADFQGRWLCLVFYPRDFSFVCPTELTALSAQIEDFERRSCSVLAISMDSLDLHREWLQTSNAAGGVEGLRFPLGSDPQGDICRAYGVWRDKEGLPNRGLFLIDPASILRYASVHELSVGRQTEEVFRVLDALQSGGLCPVNWTRADGVLDIEALLKPGRVLGHYRIEKVLGAGAFGTVMRATDLRLQRQVAIKALRNVDHHSSEELLAEARSAATIVHPNVCTIHSADVIDGLPTIVMEYIGEQSLESAIGEEVQESRLFPWVRGIAGGLAAAHDAGVTHGDLKPRNIVLRGDSDPVIVDFGLARLAGKSKPQRMVAPRPSDAPLESLAIDTTVDFDGVDVEETAKLSGNQLSLSGTPGYMSPEQAAGMPPNAQTDVFSLGILLSEIVLGQHPFAGQALFELLQTLSSEDQLSAMLERLPERYREMIRPMVALRPEDRPNAHEIHEWDALKIDQ